MTHEKSPWWFAVLLVIVALPALYFNNAAVDALGEGGWLQSDITTWLYPAYVIISGCSAWFVYPSRRTLAWVLFALLALIDIFFLILVCSR